MEQTKWTENVIVADADYVDGVAFDLTVNFERMLGRRVPQADMAQWIECVALDGGLREGNHTTMVVLLHNNESDCLKNVIPSNYKDELDGKAFRGRLGEMTITAVQTEEMADKEQLLHDVLLTVCQQPEVKRLMVVVPEQLLGTLGLVMKQTESEGRITTIFTMQPIPPFRVAGACRQELLGYSLMAALGISGKEIEEKLRG